MSQDYSVQTTVELISLLHERDAIILELQSKNRRLIEYVKQEREKQKEKQDPTLEKELKDQKELIYQRQQEISALQQQLQDLHESSSRKDKEIAVQRENIRKLAIAIKNLRDRNPDSVPDGNQIARLRLELEKAIKERDLAKAELRQGGESGNGGSARNYVHGSENRRPETLKEEKTYDAKPDPMQAARAFAKLHSGPSNGTDTSPRTHNSRQSKKSSSTKPRNTQMSSKSAISKSCDVKVQDTSYAEPKNSIPKSKISRSFDANDPSLPVLKEKSKRLKPTDQENKKISSRKPRNPHRMSADASSLVNSSGLETRYGMTKSEGKPRIKSDRRPKRTEKEEKCLKNNQLEKNDHPKKNSGEKPKKRLDLSDGGTEISPRKPKHKSSSRFLSIDTSSDKISKSQEPDSSSPTSSTSPTYQKQRQSVKITLPPVTYTYSTNGNSSRPTSPRDSVLSSRTPSSGANSGRVGGRSMGVDPNITRELEELIRVLGPGNKEEQTDEMELSLFDVLDEEFTKLYE